MCAVDDGHYERPASMKKCCFQEFRSRNHDPCTVLPRNSGPTPSVNIFNIRQRVKLSSIPSSTRFSRAFATVRNLRTDSGGRVWSVADPNRRTATDNGFPSPRSVHVRGVLFNHQGRPHNQPSRHSRFRHGVLSADSVCQFDS